MTIVTKIKTNSILKFFANNPNFSGYSIFDLVFWNLDTFFCWKNSTDMKNETKKKSPKTDDDTKWILYINQKYHQIEMFLLLILLIKLDGKRIFVEINSKMFTQKWAISLSKLCHFESYLFSKRVQNWNVCRLILFVCTWTESREKKKMKDVSCQSIYILPSI